MQRLIACLAAVAWSLLITPAAAQSCAGACTSSGQCCKNDPGDNCCASSNSPVPINARCPIGNDPISNPGATITHNGHTIAFCCPMCIAAFNDWPADRKDGFVLGALAAQSPQILPVAAQPAAAQPATARPPEPYPLDTCPIGGGKLGSMGDPVIRVINGREVRFCCAGCIAPFEADPERHFRAIDERITRALMPYYPLDRCLEANDELFDEDNNDVGINVIADNRLFRFCCKGCVEVFEFEPAPIIQRLDNAIRARQGPNYPMTTCLVRGVPLPESPVEAIVAGRLVRLCCRRCLAALRADPLKHLPTLDRAWRDAMARGKPGPGIPGAPPPHAD